LKRFLLAPLAAAALLAFAPSAFSKPIPVSPKPAAAVSTVGTVSAFAKEQAMGVTQLVERWTPTIKAAAQKFGVAEDWIKAVMRMESGGRTLLADKQPIKSDKGAMGLMQVMPETYRDMQQQYGLGGNPYNPHDNIFAGAAYLSWLHDKYGYPKMFAAYNAGPGVVEAQRKLPDETRVYLIGIAHLLGDKTSELASSETAKSATTIASLTRPNGETVTVDGAKVDSIRMALPNEYAPGVQTVIAMGNVNQGVREDLATVSAALGKPPRVSVAYLAPDHG
jgi:membrane-bound lytic murein transglycosylase B